jgi:hypothetical protein
MDIIDMEVWYQLDTIFNPWDINDAVHKDMRRWVQYYEVESTDTFPLTITLNETPVVYADPWEQYCNFAEKVLWDVFTKPYYLQTPQRALPVTYDYIFDVDPATGVGTVTIPDDLPVGTAIKILYSTNHMLAYENPFILGPDQYNASVVDGYTLGPYVETWTDELGVTHTITITDEITAMGTQIGDILSDAYGSVWYCGTLKVPAGETRMFLYPGHDRFYYEAANDNIAIDGMITVGWEVSAPEGFGGRLADLEIEIHTELMVYHDVIYDPAAGTFNITAWYDWQVLSVSEDTEGRYEWLIVGRDSAPVDSAGSSMVSEYFDSFKQIPVWMSGLDKQDQIWGPATPYVFEQLRPGLLPDTAGYRDATWGPNTGRSKLRDSWCNHKDPVTEEWVPGVPIESSNMIGVGGPEVNLLLEYTNDMTAAYFDRDTYEIVPLTCWSIAAWGTAYERTYEPEYEAGEQITGYGVISVYKDLDGTTFFLVWGFTGQDTYYTAWTLWNTWLGEKLQTEPLCLTTLIIEFDYMKHPTDMCFWSVVEALGTISEYNFIDDFKQPPIHPDP